MRNTTTATPKRKYGNLFLYGVLVTFKIIISIANGKNTEPRYEIRFAQSAVSKQEEYAKNV